MKKPLHSVVCVGIVSAFLTQANPVPIESHRIWNSRPFYQNFSNAPENNIFLTQDALEKGIDEMHTRFEDEVFFYPQGRQSPDLWRSDAFLPTQIGALWRQVSGEWNSVFVKGDFQAPLGQEFATVVYLDPTPHTPGLWQETWVTYGLFGGVQVTHKAWLLDSPKRENFYRDLGADYSVGSSIPSPSGLVLFGIGAVKILKRERRDH